MSVQVLAPPLGTTVDTVTLVAWYKHEGERVRAGEALFAVETDKATLDVEAPASGILREVTCTPGTQVHALDRIALIETKEGEDRSQEGFPLSAEPVTSGIAPGTSEGDKRENKGAVLDRTFISPRAKRMAEAQNIEWKAIQGTGPEGAIVERDVTAHLESLRRPSITPVAARVAEQAGLDWTRLEGTGVGGRVTRDDVQRAATAGLAEPESTGTIPLTGVRGLIAERMQRSHRETARVTLTAEEDATAIVELRAKLIADGIEASYDDLFLFVLARALREHPRLNASLEGDKIHVWTRIDIGVAVDTERGLMVPVVRDVGGKGLEQIGIETRALVKGAREGTLPPASLRGGTFTLTNLGMFGIDGFTPIINLPECAILGVGRIAPRPAVVDGQVAVRQMVWLSLTFDHRLVDGAPAARFLQRIVQLITRPHLMLT
jgi:pyruvate dehydrogenase E2 component (dihydrolipoyllysine-residue acetyltransferase)